MRLAPLVALSCLVAAGGFLAGRLMLPLPLADGAAPLGARESAPAPRVATIVAETRPEADTDPRLAGSLDLPELWADYRSRFVSEAGRVIDTANGDISHSEGQGYGLVMALAAGDRPTFERIWAWTRANLDTRDDGLAAWRWDPASDPNVTDPNNASDGDLLIAWALAEAGEHWRAPAFTRAAEARIAALIPLVGEAPDGTPVLSPAVHGFSAADRPDGPVVNLSYWVFPALQALDRVDGDGPWTALIASGLELLAQSRFGPRDLPPEWLALAGETPAPAAGFDPVFGYNAVRVPLYLAWAGIGARHQLAPFAAEWAHAAPATVDLTGGARKPSMGEPGYRVVADLVACAMEGVPLPAAARRPAGDSYYPATLRILSIIAVKQRYPECW